MEHDQLAGRLRRALDAEVARHEISPAAWSRIERRLRPQAWRRAAILAVAAAALAAVAVAAPAVWDALSRHAAAPASPASPRLVVTGRDRLPGRAAAVAVGFGSVWAVGSDVIYRVDQATDRTVATIPAQGAGVPDGIAAGLGAVWVASDRGGPMGVYRIDPRTDRVTAFIPLQPDPRGVAIAGGRVWVAETSGQAPCVLVRIDPARNRTTGSPTPVGDDPSVVSGAGSLWVTSGAGDSLDRVDPATGAVTAEWSILNVDAAGAGSLWGTTGDGVERIDPATGATTAAITLPGTQYVVFWAGSAWAVTGTPSGGIFRIDPHGNRVSGLQVRLGRDLTWAAAGPGALWVDDYSRGELLRLALTS